MNHAQVLEPQMPVGAPAGTERDSVTFVPMSLLCQTSDAAKY